MAKFSNSVVQLIESCERNAQRLLTLLTTESDCFKDEALLEDGDRAPVKVTLYKRAQILIADLWALFQGQGLGEFTDIDSLTMFADYRVPQSLQYFGALVYSEVRLIFTGIQLFRPIF